MRLLATAVLVGVLAGSAALTDGEAARKPTPKERAAVSAAVILGIPHVEGQAAFFLVRRVVMSTVEPGRRSSFVRFAAAVGIAKDQSGLYPAGPRTALVAVHRRTGNWSVVDYGVRRVGCTTPHSFFGGRRAAILRDLGIRCG